jgi:toxin ParE1/3/4
MKTVIKLPRAKEDLIEHYANIADDKVDPAERFLKVAEKSLSLLADMPVIGRLFPTSNPRLADLRVYPLPQGFRSYLVFYRKVDEGIEVVRVLHAKRDLQRGLTASDQNRSPRRHPCLSSVGGVVPAQPVSGGETGK